MEGWQEQAASALLPLDLPALAVEPLMLFPHHVPSLRDARLLETDLRDADFTEADLREADAGGTVSRHAGLCPADVRGAGLTEADLLEVRLNGAVADEH
ncbi:MULTISPECIES: pentapeptide repeat-containing protein [Streptomyces]|nr:pentapeptide repeat-containing protein [Streptomyces sp. WAC06273]MDV6291111.1 pentapeptide repeat-containing protein [Streptomyces sp. UP1A-1]